jgi:hypothetical protein
MVTHKSSPQLACQECLSRHWRLQTAAQEYKRAWLLHLSQVEQLSEQLEGARAELAARPDAAVSASQAEHARRQVIIPPHLLDVPAFCRSVLLMAGPSIQPNTYLV